MSKFFDRQCSNEFKFYIFFPTILKEKKIILIVPSCNQIDEEKEKEKEEGMKLMSSNEVNVCGKNTMKKKK